MERNQGIGVTKDGKIIMELERKHERFTKIEA